MAIKHYTDKTTISWALQRVNGAIRCPREVKSVVVVGSLNNPQSIDLFDTAEIELHTEPMASYDEGKGWTLA